MENNKLKGLIMRLFVFLMVLSILLIIIIFFEIKENSYIKERLVDKDQVIVIHDNNETEYEITLEPGEARPDNISDVRIKETEIEEDKRVEEDAKIRDGGFIIGGTLNPLLFNWDNLSACLKVADELFDVVVDESYFKWKSVERERGEVDFSGHKKTMQWAKEHDKKIRHHTLFWSNPKRVPDWAKELSDEELKEAILDRIAYTKREVGEYVTSLDVVNEMLDYDYFRSRLGDGIIKEIYDETRKAFPDAKLYVNEAPYRVCAVYDCSNLNTKEEYKNYIISEFLDFLDYLKANEVFYDGIALQAHFKDTELWTINKVHLTNEDNIELYDTLITKIHSKTGKKVLISEFDFNSKSEKTKSDFVKGFGSMVLNHKYTEGIIYWSWFIPKEKALVEHDMCTLNPAGEAYNILQKLAEEPASSKK